MAFRTTIYAGCKHLGFDELCNDHRGNVLPEWYFFERVRSELCLNCVAETREALDFSWNVRYSHVRAIYAMMGGGYVGVQQSVGFKQNPDDLFITQALVSKTFLLIMLTGVFKRRATVGWNALLDRAAAELRPDIWHAVGWEGYRSFLRWIRFQIDQRGYKLSLLDICGHPEQKVLADVDAWTALVMSASRVYPFELLQASFRFSRLGDNVVALGGL